MSFASLYRISFYVMLTLATLAMSVDAPDNRLAMLYPVAVAASAVAAFFTVDRDPRLGLSRWLANLLALACVGLSYVEFRVDENLLLLALTHWLVYLMLIKMFLPKTVEDDWFLFLLGLTQVLAGVVMSQSDQVGVVLFCWVVSAFWVLGLFSLHREALRAGGPAKAAPGPAEPPPDPYPGLLDLSYIVSTLRVTATALALGGLIFLIMPRSESMGSAKRGQEKAQHLTGFDDQVKLGQMGEILENDTIVMTVEFLDNDFRRASPPGEPLFRGTTMALYRDGRWHRQPKRHGSLPPPPSAALSPSRIIQRIKLEPQDNTVLFALRPILSAESDRRFKPELNPIDGSLYRADPRGGSYDYEVESSTNPADRQPGEILPDGYRRTILASVGEPLGSRLAAIAAPIVAEIPEGDALGRARALEAYLRDSRRFGYTLRMDVIDPNLDPVEDFLVNRKEGHCEYFASALTLMLRAVGIPARMVNGFKGGDWNGLSGAMSVREKHAHSWTEALIEDPGSGTSGWVTFDPTPAAERDRTVASVGGVASYFRGVTDFVRYVWVFYVVGYNKERQTTLVYEPAKKVVQEAQRGFREMGEAIDSAVRGVFDFPTFASLISVRGFLVTFFGLTLAALVFRGLAWLGRRLLRALRGREKDEAKAAGAAFYRRMAQLLAEQKLVREPGQTQLEFARGAARVLAARGPATAAVADVPASVVDAYYRLRFGRLDLPPSALEALEARLDALEASLRAGQA